MLEKKISLGRDKDGKLIRKSVRGKTKAEIEKKTFQVRQEWMEQSNNKPTNDITLVSFARHWLKTEKQHAAINTKAMYENVIEKHLAAELSDLYFSEITQSDLQNIINLNFEKYETCNKIKLTLRQLYEAARDNEIETHKSVNIKKLLMPKKEKNEKRALTKEEIAALTEAKLTDKQKAFVNLLYYSGIRREEALALDYKAVDLKNKTLKINQALVFDKNAPRIERTKNIYSNRVIHIPTALCAVLSDYGRGKKGLMFTMNNGEPMTQSSFTKFWMGIQKSLSEVTPSAQELTPHIFRHNYATMLYYSDISIKEAARIMGHSNTQMIMQIYAHLDAEKENTAEKIEKVFA